MTAQKSTPLDNSLVISMTQSVLDNLATRYPGWGDPRDVNSKWRDDSLPLTPANEDSVSLTTTTRGVFSDLFEMLIEKSRKIENQLAESGEIFFEPTSYRIALSRDDDNNIQCFMGAVVYDDDGTRVVIDVEQPQVTKIIRTGSERPFTERIRIFSQLICIFSQIICATSNPHALSRRFISNFAQTVSAFSIATAQHRNPQASSSNNRRSNTGPQRNVHDESINLKEVAEAAKNGNWEGRSMSTQKENSPSAPTPGEQEQKLWGVTTDNQSAATSAVQANSDINSVLASHQAWLNQNQTRHQANGGEPTLTNPAYGTGKEQEKPNQAEPPSTGSRRLPLLRRALRALHRNRQKGQDGKPDS